MDESSSDVTLVLQAIERGDRQAAEQLLPLVYDELRRLAAERLSRESADQTLQATALVHEAYLRLVGDEQSARAQDAPHWNSRGHFFGAAAEAMRRILIEQARRKQSLKHGGAHQREQFAELEIAAPEPNEDLLALEMALSKLEIEQPVHAQLIKLRYFAGLTLPQAAELLQLSTRTAERHWTYARAWLLREIRAE